MATPDTTTMIAMLDAFPAVLRAVVVGLSDAQVRWKPSPGDWSIIEVLRHLEDEEHEDFPPRLRSTLEDPQRKWEPIEPQAWPADRDYANADLAATLDGFASERARTLAWFRGVCERGDADWTASYAHWVQVERCAGDLLAAWVAHDQLHLRQITKRRFQLVAKACEGFTLDYAGEW
ncbi:MAG: DinB family protein [Planctomycetota bacterium]